MTICNPSLVRQTCLLHSQPARPGLTDPGKFGAAIGALSKAVEQLDPEGNDVTQANRRLVCGFIFCPDDKPLMPISGDQLTPQQKNALYRWYGATLVDGRWLPRTTFAAEANWCLSVALILQAVENDNGGRLTMARLMQGYETERGAIGSLDTADYWLAQAIGLRGALVTRVYQEAVI